LQGSVLVSRKSSSTPSLSEAVEPKLTIASTDQVASAENLTSSSSSEPVSYKYFFMSPPHVVSLVAHVSVMLLHACICPSVRPWISKHWSRFLVVTGLAWAVPSRSFLATG